MAMKKLRAKQSAGGCCSCARYFGILLTACASFGQETNPPAASQIAALKELSLEELFAAEITTVSRRPERLATAPSAVQVISGEDIRRSGATSLPEALRLDRKSVV